ncbi:MAG: BglII/BstYI family type II restriction endonuclease [Candidatus Methylomirabilales bacterium]
MKIRRQILYDGAKERIRRLKLRPLLDEVREMLKTTVVRLEERKHANSGGALRKLLDVEFERREGWTRRTSGASDWKKCQEIDGAEVCIEVEIQVSARSDLVVIDIYHLRRSIQNGEIDLGILVVPSDKFSPFLRSRQPSLKETQRAVEETDAHRLPLVVLAIEHDGPGPALVGGES